MKKFFYPLILLLIVLPTLIPFFNSKFFYTQDHIFIARLQQMSTALSSGQFPVRWAPDLRYGEPLFNFYAPLPYYIGALIHLFGVNFIWVAKILFMLSAVLSAATVYLLVNKLFGQKAGILAAVLYTYAPYRAVDMYVRGSLSETWAFVFLPLIFYLSILLAEKTSFRNISLLAFSLAGLFLTHNVTTLMFLPFLVSWWIYLILRDKKWKIILHLSLASILGFGLAAFFLLPAFFESGFIQTKYLTVGYFNFRAHFVAFKQFFSLFWGYGSSVWGLDDGLSFQIGLVNLVVLAAAAILAIFHYRDKKFLVIISFLGISFLGSLFLQHNKSAFIWEAIPEMAFIQFPWRFLGISVFIIALTGGAIAVYLKNRLRPLYFILIFAAIASTLMYFRPKGYADDKFFDKFLQVERMNKGEDLTKDYLPIWVQTTEGERFNEPRAEKGQVAIKNFKRNSTKLEFSADVLSKSLIEVPLSFFPGWQVKADNQSIDLLPTSRTGLIRFELPEGRYNVEVELFNTPIRTAGNMISLASIILVFFMYLNFLPRKKNL
ncbi:glycosyltransferase family 39 protein [Candidatus Daviesbacteria bacterium]|nr:glycosyltransferase family 39 protein [Candidatus Daviesbacteria bacterium]